MAEQRPARVADDLDARQPAAQGVRNGLVPDRHAKDPADRVGRTGDRQPCEGRQGKGAAAFRLPPLAARIGDKLLNIFLNIVSCVLTIYSC